MYIGILSVIIVVLVVIIIYLLNKLRRMKQSRNDFAQLYTNIRKEIHENGTRYK